LFSSAFTCGFPQLLFSEVERPELPGLSSRPIVGASDRAGILRSDVGAKINIFDGISIHDTHFLSLFNRLNYCKKPLVAI